MSLKDLNLNKVIGREAILQGQWTATTSDGQTHAIWAGLKSSLIGNRIIVTANEAPVLDERKLVIAGQLAEFEIGGDVFALRHSGMGLMGKLGLVQNGRKVGKDDAPNPSAASPSTATPSTEDQTWETWIEEAERYREPLGDEVRVIDNSRSNSPTERKVTVSREWSQNIALDMEKATEVGANLDLKLPWSVGFNSSAKQSVTRKYAVSEGSKRTYSEEVTINVSAKTKSTITFSWRQVWQKGIVVGRNPEGREIRAPFEVKLHPTFDQIQEDVAEAKDDEGKKA